AARRSFHSARPWTPDRFRSAERCCPRPERHRGLSWQEVGGSGRDPREIGGSSGMKMMKSPTRRSVTAGLALGALAAPALRVGPAWGQAKSVKMAMIAPLSGPWARQGQLLRQGAEMAIDEINQKGGIEKLGGAKFEPVVAD